MSKTVIFQAIQFSLSTVSMSKTFLFQAIQLSLSIVSMSKAVLFQVFQFSISMKFSSNLTIERLYQVLPLRSRAMLVKGYSALLKAPAIRFFSVISRTLIGGVLPLCRVAVGVFYSPSRQGNIFCIEIKPSPTNDCPRHDNN